ncbi:Integrase, catalytic core [Gossypium australe]|uniref:Integrase, catalytic core n=1 Tax=Gossypium australe TaxID=47621 RepID=A0A5B6VPS5_9ROSI|nr:Integrase, catalytic core [Gossypium australe]
MTPDAAIFKSIDRSFNTRVKVGNGHYIKVEGKGDVLIDTPSGTKLVSHVLLVPEIDRNLLSIAQLLENGYSVVFKGKECLISDPSGSKLMYFIIFIDDYSRFCWGYFLKCKSEVASVFWKFKVVVETQSSCKLKTLRSKNGMEYTSAVFQTFCEKSCIKHQLTNTYTPQQNGVSEIKNRTLMDMARCLMFERNLPKSFWAEAVNTDKSELEYTAEDLVTEQTKADQNDLEMDIDHEPVRGTRPLSEKYERENVATEISVEQPEGFKVVGEEDKVFKLRKTLYGLKQAPMAWYDRIDTYLVSSRFERSISEPTLYVKKEGDETLLIVSLYVDDLLVTRGNNAILTNFKGKMESMFEMSDLGEMSYFLATRPDIMFAVSLLSRFMHCCNMDHFQAAKRVLRKIMADMNLHQREATEIRCDNQSAVAIAKNPMFHGKTKHFKIKFHFVREMEQSQEIRLVHCSSEDQLADILTKPLCVSRFKNLIAKLGV